MAYAQATITDVNPNAVFMTQFDNMMLAEGWTVEDEFTPSGDYRVKVYKSAAANNQCGYDWYVGACWDAIGSESYLTILSGSTYDNTTKVLDFVPVTGQTASNNTTVTGSHPNAQRADGAQFGDATLSNTAWVTNANGVNVGVAPTGSPRNGRALLPSSSFGYWLSITPDHVMWAFTGSGFEVSGGYFTINVHPNYDSHYNGGRTDVVCAWGATGTQANTYGANGSVTPGSLLILMQTGGLTNGARSWRFLNSMGEGIRSSELPALTDPVTGIAAAAYRPRISAQYMGDDYRESAGIGNLPNIQSIQAADQYAGAQTDVNYGYATSVPILVGEGIDIWQVRGGSLGDTITIEGNDYVILAANGMAVLVES